MTTLSEAASSARDYVSGKIGVYANFARDKNTGPGACVEAAVEEKTLDALIRDFGLLWEVPSVTSQGYEIGKPHECYCNALHLALSTKDLLYAQGYVVFTDIGIPIEHAWCVKLDDRSVVECTVDKPRPAAYYGVVFDPEWAATWMVRQGYYGFYPVTHYGKKKPKFMTDAYRRIARPGQTPWLPGQKPSGG